MRGSDSTRNQRRLANDICSDRVFAHSGAHAITAGERASASAEAIEITLGNARTTELRAAKLFEEPVGGQVRRPTCHGAQVIRHARALRMRAPAMQSSCKHGKLDRGGGRKASVRVPTRRLASAQVVHPETGIAVKACAEPTEGSRESLVADAGAMGATLTSGKEP